jgi:Uma2 family endonuclease
MPKTVRVPEKPTPDTFAWPTDLPSDDGEPMDTPWHRDQMYLLIDLIETHWAGRKDFYSGGNMFLYFSLQYVKNTDFRGPDFFVVKDTDHDKERKYWALWEENNRAPAVIVELMSETTRETDLGEKKDIYERTLRTPEYYCFDPDDWSLRGWRLTNGKYVVIKPDKAGRLRSEQLDLSFGLWEGRYLGHSSRWFRMFSRPGRLVLTAAEAEAAAGARVAARAKARADQEAARADQAEAEVARLKQELAQARRKNGKHK